MPQLPLENDSDEAVESRPLLLLLDSMIEYLPAMIFLKDARELRFQRFNRAGEELLGLSRVQLLGKTDYDFFPKEQAEFFIAKDREVLRRKTLEDIPAEPIETPRGTRWLHTRKIPILGGNGEPTHLLGVSIDITERVNAEASLRASHKELQRDFQDRTDQLHQEVGERKRAEEALQRTEEQLRQVQKMEAIGRLAGGVAHDFNNLLTAILGYSQLIMDRLKPTDENYDELQEIQKAGSRAADLTRQLLAFSRRQVLVPRVLDLNVVVADMDKMLHRLIGEHIQLRHKLQEDLGRVKADPGQIEQVIMNLAINARDAISKGGSITVETQNVDLDDSYARSHPEVKAGSYVMLAVSDTGVGMDLETQARIFEPFFTTKEQGKGTGLGLSMVYGIIKQSNGHVSVYSERDHGSTFKVYLPSVGDRAETYKSGVFKVPFHGGSETVLVVEDEEMVRKLTCNVLRTHGYTVIEARNGAEALEYASRRQKVPRLMITDMVMPGMSGRELAGKMAMAIPGLRLLFVSGYTEDAIIQKGALDAITPFLPKPFTPQSLLLKVREVLEAAFPQA